MAAGETQLTNISGLARSWCGGGGNQAGFAALLAGEIVLVHRVRCWRALATVKAAGLNVAVGFTESHNSRGWKGPLWSPSPTLLPKQGHLQQAAQDLVQAALEYLQRRRLHNLPGQPVPARQLPCSSCPTLNLSAFFHREARQFQISHVESNATCILSAAGNRSHRREVTGLGCKAQKLMSELSVVWVADI